MIATIPCTGPEAHERLDGPIMERDVRHAMEAGGHADEPCAGHRAYRSGRAFCAGADMDG